MLIQYRGLPIRHCKYSEVGGNHATYRYESEVANPQVARKDCAFIFVAQGKWQDGISTHDANKGAI